MTKKLIIASIIIAALITGYLIWDGQRDQGQQTPEQIEAELQRLEEEKGRLEEDVRKVEEGEVACILVYDPVCGTDGKTYSNSCFAGVAGVEIAHQGECK